MSRATILLVGAGGHARSCIDVIEQEGRYAISGLVGLTEELGSRVLGYEVVGTDQDLPALLHRFDYALITVGQIKSADLRADLYARVLAAGGKLPVIVSPQAYVSAHASIEAGTIVMHGAVVNAGAKVGQNCIVNSKALIEHDASIGDHCHISTAAVINGDVWIGERCFIGSNACIRQGAKVAQACVVGMGQRVLDDCAAESWVHPRKEWP